MRKTLMERVKFDFEVSGLTPVSGPYVSLTLRVCVCVCVCVSLFVTRYQFVLFTECVTYPGKSEGVISTRCVVPQYFGFERFSERCVPLESVSFSSDLFLLFIAPFSPLPPSPPQL